MVSFYLLTFSHSDALLSATEEPEQKKSPCLSRIELYSRISEVIHYDSTRATMSGFLQYTSYDRYYSILDKNSILEREVGILVLSQSMGQHALVARNSSIVWLRSHSKIG